MGKDDRLHSGHRLDESAMRRRRNRWHVYEYMKDTYMFSGRVPTREEVEARFQNADPQEIAEGIAEFIIVLQRFVPSIREEQVVGR